jgi:hypothetical protein
MAPKRCPYCEREFVPSPYRPSQQVCSAEACQRQRKTNDHRKRKAEDPVYAEACRDAQRQWREANPGYHRQYCRSHPEQIDRNRRQQQARDARRKLTNLAKNNLAFDLTSSISKVFLLGPAASLLDKNNLAQSKLVIYQTVAVSSPILQRTT